MEEGPQSLANQEGGVFRTTDAEGQSVLLAIDAQDALATTFILKVGGSLELALRPKGEEGITETDVVDELWLADRSNIDLIRN